MKIISLYEENPKKLMGLQSSPKNSLKEPKKIKIALQKQKYQKDKKEKNLTKLSSSLKK